MFSNYKILDYLIPILSGLLVLVFALAGIKKTTKDDNKREKLVKNIILASLMLIISFILIFMWFQFFYVPLFYI